MNIFNKFTVTVLLSCHSDKDAANTSFSYFLNQPVNLILFKTKHGELPDISEKTENVTILSKEYNNSFFGYKDALKSVETPFVQFCLSGDFATENAYSTISESINNVLNQNTDNNLCNLFMLNTVYSADNINISTKESFFIDLNITPEKVPLSFYNILFNSEIAKKVSFDTASPLDNGKFMLWKILTECTSLYCIQNATFISTAPNLKSGDAPHMAQNKKWYFETLSKGILPALKDINDKYDYIPKHIQYAVFFEILKRFAYNLNTKNKHVCDDDASLYIFYDLVSQTLQFIDNYVIFNVGKYLSFRASNSLKLHLMTLKYGDDFKIDYVLEAASKQFYLSYDGIIFERFAAQNIFVDVINKEKDGFIIECSFMDLTPRKDYELHAVLGDYELDIIDTKRFAQIEYFGRSVHDKRTFIIHIPYNILDQADKTSLKFYAVLNNTRISLKFNSSRFPSRVAANVKNSYWYSGRYFIKYEDNQFNMCFYAKGKKRHLKFELDYLKTIFKFSKSLCFFRILYWLTKPYFNKKHIWITFDKMYKTGDNGDYFYRYALQQNDGITKKYIANKGYPDTIKMQKEGLKPLLFSTPKQRLYFLNASIIAATHANIPVFSGTSPNKFKYLQDLLKGEVVCIQHGLAVQQLAHNLNSQYDNTRKFYCASPYEIKNLEQDCYGYYDKKDLSLVGLGRYDGLVNNDKKQILITPTWRAYISMPVSIGNTRPYSPTFKETNYFKIYNSLISNEKLIKTASKCGYKIVYLLHPTISSQLDDYTPGESVEIKSPVGINYEQILTESSLMLTDYSGVQFDFAYMRKPIVYYHTPILPPHYEEGGFFYDTMGFGEICLDEDNLVNTLCEYMENQCTMKDLYKKRADDFFAFDDRNSCKRIYNEIKAFDEECSKLNLF